MALFHRLRFWVAIAVVLTVTNLYTANLSSFDTSDGLQSSSLKLDKATVLAARSLPPSRTAPRSGAASRTDAPRTGAAFGLPRTSASLTPTLAVRLAANAPDAFELFSGMDLHGHDPEDGKPPSSAGYDIEKCKQYCIEHSLGCSGFTWPGCNIKVFDDYDLARVQLVHSSEDYSAYFRNSSDAPVNEAGSKLASSSSESGCKDTGASELCAEARASHSVCTESVYMRFCRHSCSLCNT